jgi:hypothetical protein
MPGVEPTLEGGCTTSRYSWKQTRADVTVTVNCGPTITVKDIRCTIRPTFLPFALAGTSYSVEGRHFRTYRSGVLVHRSACFCTMIYLFPSLLFVVLWYPSTPAGRL